LESAGLQHGGIQHWGMFYNLAPDVISSHYPKLDTWKAVRRRITKDGTLTTFDSDFSKRSGLS
jgi:hypothetical protein